MSDYSRSGGAAFVAALALAAFAVHVAVVSRENLNAPFCPVVYDTASKQTRLATGVANLWLTDGSDTSAPPAATTKGVVVGEGVAVSLTGGYSVRSQAAGIVEVLHGEEVLFTAYEAAIVAGRINPFIRAAIATYKQGMYLGGVAPNVAAYGQGNPVWTMHSQMVTFDDRAGNFATVEWVTGAGEVGLRYRTASNEVVLTDNRVLGGPNLTKDAITKNPESNAFDRQVVVQRQVQGTIPECINIPVDGTINQFTVTKLRAPSTCGNYLLRDVLVQRTFTAGSGECIVADSSVDYLFSTVTPTITPGSLKLNGCPGITSGTNTLSIRWFTSADCSGTPSTATLQLGTCLASGSLWFACSARV